MMSKQPPKSARRASRIEHADAKVAAVLGDHHEHPVVATLGKVSEVADQPPLIALTAATAIIGFATRNPTLARAGLRMLASELIATGIKARIKARIDRTRPHKMIEDGHYAARNAGKDARSDGPWSSFPSGHTAGAVAVTRALARDYPALALPAAATAGTIAAIQLPRRSHFPTDVIAGAAIGWLAETLVTAAISRLARTRSSVPLDQPPSAAL